MVPRCCFVFFFQTAAMPAKGRRPRRFQRHHRLHYPASFASAYGPSLHARPVGRRASGSKLQGPAKPDSRPACGAGFSWEGGV